MALPIHPRHESKRGLIVRHCSHAQLFGARARRWLYNYGGELSSWGRKEWTTDPACRSLSSTFEFVPMVADLGAIDHAHFSPRSKHLLGMNEPAEFKNESAKAVAKRWSQVEALADRGFTPRLRLGTPAPGGLDLKKGERWLASFFEHCRECHIDMLALHWYECDGSTQAAAEASARSMLGWLHAMHLRYHKPIWLTEFNCGDGAAPQPFANQSAANHIRFMQAALPLLDAAAFVHRYSWFQAWQRHTPTHPGHNPGCSLLDLGGGRLSDLGVLYNT